MVFNASKISILLTTDSRLKPGAAGSTSKQHPADGCPIAAFNCQRLGMSNCGSFSDTLFVSGRLGVRWALILAEAHTPPDTWCYTWHTTTF